jgi:hypothetical protein
MQEIGVKYTTDFAEFFAQMERVSDSLGKVDELLSRQAKKNPLAEVAAKQTQFNQQLGLQVQLYQRVEAAASSFRQEQDRIKRVVGQIKAAQNELAAANHYGELKKQIGQVETALNKSINAPLKESLSWWDKLKAAFSKGLRIPKIDISGLPDTPAVPTPKPTSVGKGGSVLKQAGGALVDEVAGGVGLSSLTVAGGVAAGVAAITGTVIKGTKEWADYSAKLDEVAALTGATGKSLQYLDDQAQQIEQDTGIAGTEILNAFKNIAGIKPELLENNQALAATTKEVITLAQASKLGLDETAKSLLGSLSQFNEGADQAARFSNVLAAGAKLGNSEINDTAEALKNSGTAMKAAGLSFEQGNSLLQILAKGMIKGSEAGTSLRNILLKLETQSDKNLRPSIVGLDVALENASKKFNTTTALTKVFGQENIVAAKQVLDARGEVSKMTEALSGTSIAYEQAKINTDNLANDLTKAGTGINAFFRSLGESNDGFLRTTVQSFNAFVGSLTSKTGALRTFFSEAFSFKTLINPVGSLTEAAKAAYDQRQTNLKTEAKQAIVDKISSDASQSVTEATKQLQAAYEKQGLEVPKAERAAADKQREVRQQALAEARADHERLKAEALAAGRYQEGASQTLIAKYSKQYEASRRRLLAAQVAQKQAEATVARLDKADNDAAIARKKAASEGPSDAQKKADKKALDAQNETNRLLLAAREEYAKEAQKLEADYGKERLELLQKDGEAYINARADLDQQELQLQRDAIEKKLQLARSTKTAEVNGKRQVVADPSITLENSAPLIAQIFADRQQQIEDQRARQLQLSRIRQEYQLLELAKKSNETELQLFDTFWEEKLAVEKKNTETYDALLNQREAARKLIAVSGTRQEIAAFEEAWQVILANEKKNTAVYEAMVAKRNRDRNALAVDLILKQTNQQEGIETAFTDTNRFEQNLRADDPSLNADDITERREQAKLAIRIRYGEETLKLLKEQGEAENALLITQTQAALDALKKQQTELTNNTPRSRDIYELLGITDGMNEEQLGAFRKGMQQIGDAIQQTTQLIIEQSDEKIQALDAQIQAKQEQVSVEEARDKEGYANNLSLRKKELEDLKRQKAEEESVKRKALAVQQAIDAATQISNQAVAISEGIRFLTSYASRSAALGPIAGPIAYFATVASILASIYAVTKQFKALTAVTKLRQGGKLRGPSHEQGGIRGTGAFTDIEAEGGEYVTNKRSARKYDQTLEALNADDPHQAIAALVREGKVGLPDLVVTHINRPDFNVQAQTTDLSVLTAELKEQKALTQAMLKHLRSMDGKKQFIPLGEGVYLEQDGDHSHLKDVRHQVKKLGR